MEDSAPPLLREAVTQVKKDLQELEAYFSSWSYAANINGSRKVRGIANRIVGSAERVKELVKENSFAR